VKILRRLATREKTGLSDPVIDREEAQGRFPKRIKLSERAVGWLEKEIDQWIADRVAARDAGKGETE
jgi:prophage regulatory protein